MNAILTITAKEIRQAVRNRWVFAATLLLAALALSLTFLGSAPSGSNVGARPLDVIIVSLSSLTIFLVPLIALLIAHDAIVGDMERGTMLLLLSYPVARWQVLVGKFCGHLAVLAFATCFGYGAAVAALLATGSDMDREGLEAFIAMIASSVLLGAVFIAIGYWVSAQVRDRGTAAGVCIGLWLLLVLVYDMALLGLLVLDKGQNMSGPVLNTLLLLNPTDIYRLLNLTGFANVSAFSGMAGLAGSATLSVRVLVAALALWTLIPLTAASLSFSRREL
ncbi:ABC transporter permease subunit [Bradyrhizobium sp. Arg237L]|uniref:ABC transporter permease subunit n=1 Tax=Bradyrhizobium sp. Arg237L TaxID=3003352 RepID=UPI00249E0A3D|nr:ABC transporter permease subunit [Bradyrhizobium sp. Arg237L]MDI4233250.1 ABC transporter permease subunit [Bradyrhizobium sp. Arg237L]